MAKVKRYNRPLDEAVQGDIQERGFTLSNNGLRWKSSNFSGVVASENAGTFVLSLNSRYQWSIQVTVDETGEITDIAKVDTPETGNTQPLRVLTKTTKKNSK